MSHKSLNLLTTFGAVLIGTALLLWWLLYNPVAGFSENLPGADNRPEGYMAGVADVDIGSDFMTFEGIPSQIQAGWPRFRGSDFDNINKENLSLAESWGGASGPELLWSVDLGEGHAGPVVSGGRVYVMDYDEESRADVLRCFSLADGAEIWRRGYSLFIKRNHGMSRTIPAATEEYVVTMGPMCHVMCVDAASGDLKWGLDLVKEYKAEIPLWYTGQCPLIDGTTAVLAVGGDALLIGVNCETGEILWETANPEAWKMSHSSVLPFTIHGKRLYVYCALGGIVGISAEPDEKGEVVFASNIWDHNVVAPSPVYLGDGRIFITAGYGAGSMMVRVKNEKGVFSLESVQSYKPAEGLASEQQTPIFYKGHLFSILPKDAGPLRNQFVCCHPDDCRTFVWSSGKTHRFGLGPYLVADDKFYILSDDGVLTVLETSTRGYVPLAEAKVLEGVDAWGPMALVQGRLLLRDSRRLVCLDVRAR
jgi:outer membrane protein assembly factor BamB